MNELIQFLNMLAHSNQDYQKLSRGSDQNRMTQITITGQSIEMHFDKDGKFEGIYNERRCTNMTCDKCPR